MCKSGAVSDITNLKARMTDAFATITVDMLENTWREIDYRLDVLRATEGAHVEVYWCVVKKKLLELSYILKKKIYVCIPRSFLVINVCNQGKTLCSPCRTIIVLVENWSLTLREEHRLRVFHNMVLRRIFGPKTDDVTVDWRKLHNEELHNLYSSPNIILVIKPWTKKRVWQVTCVLESWWRVPYRISVGKPERKREFGTPRRRWRDNIKTDLKEFG